MAYSNSELGLIKDAVACGFTYNSIANEINRKFHAGKNVRTGEGVRKQAKK